jgi:flagellar biosynthesis anti-sigma factor FlgM
MKIDPRHIADVKKVRSQKDVTTPKAAAEKASTTKKVVDLSDDAMLVKKAKESIDSAGEALSPKVQKIKELVDSGNYKVDDEKLAEILEKLL